MILPRLVATLALLLVVASPAAAQVPGEVSYQGVLTDTSGTVINDGTYMMWFVIYDQAEAGTGAFHYFSFFDVQIENGIYSVSLPAIDSGQRSLEDALQGGPRFMEVRFLHPVEAVVALPRQLITSVPYALSAATVEQVTLKDGPLCDLTTEGALRYAQTEKAVQFCDGVAWRPLFAPQRGVDSMDSSSSTWIPTPANALVEPELAIRAEGLGSLKVTAGDPTATAVSKALGGVDWSGHQVGVRVRVDDPAGVTADDGVRIQITDSAGSFALWHFGTQAGVGAGSFGLVLFDPSILLPESSSGVLDLASVSDVTLTHNTVLPQAGRVVYFDDLLLMQPPSLRGPPGAKGDMGDPGQAGIDGIDGAQGPQGDPGQPALNINAQCASFCGTSNENRCFTTCGSGNVQSANEVSGGGSDCFADAGETSCGRTAPFGCGFPTSGQARCCVCR